MGAYCIVSEALIFVINNEREFKQVPARPNRALMY